MDETCQRCKHFRQHYVKHGRMYMELTCGHCVYPRLKKRETTDKACDKFKKRP